MAKEFLGHGLAFPVALAAKEGQDERNALAWASAEDKVRQSLLTILATARGERVMRPDFGSRLHELVFEPLDSATKSRAAQYATEAIRAWEPRVELLNVDVAEDPVSPGTLRIAIDYRVRATNSRFNLVYPFYLREGDHAFAT